MRQVLGQVHWEDPEEWVGREVGGDQDAEHM